MPESNATEVIRDAVTVIDELGVTLLFTQHELPHVEAFERELHKRVNLLPATKAISISRCLEALEADDEDARNSVDLHRFCCPNELLAPAAVPLVLLVQGL